MQTRALIFRTGLAVVALSGAVAVWAQTPAAPAKPAAPAQPEKKKDVPVATIAGMAIARKDGRWLGLSLEGGGFKLCFYDKDKKPEDADAALAALRWNPTNVVGIERVVLNPDADKKSLSNSKFVKPPFNFKLFITLLSANNKVVEDFQVDFRG